MGKDAHDETDKQHHAACQDCGEHRDLCAVLHSLHNRIVKLEGRVDMMEKPSPRRHPE